VVKSMSCSHNLHNLLISLSLFLAAQVGPFYLSGMIFCRGPPAEDAGHMSLSLAEADQRRHFPHQAIPVTVAEDTSVTGVAAICVKAYLLDRDVSSDLLEWLLLAREQRYGRVYFYFFKGVHPNVLKVIK